MFQSKNWKTEKKNSSTIKANKSSNDQAEIKNRNEQKSSWVACAYIFLAVSLFHDQSLDTENGMKTTIQKINKIKH